MNLDPRLTAARADLAAGALEGLVPAARYAAAIVMQAMLPVTAVRSAPNASAGQLDQLLFGEVFDVAEAAEGFAWGQARRDGYVGYVSATALARDLTSPTHWVSALRTFAFDKPSIKAPAWGSLSQGALVTVTQESGALAHAAGAGWIARAHLTPIGVVLTDPSAVAERFVGAPYLWGGRDSLGLDCSGLVQQALFAVGRACPRDSEQQQALGEAADPGGLGRGDLVFWRGHVGMMLDATRLLHANAHHMAVTIEPLAEVAARVAAAGGGDPIAWRRP